MNPIATPLLRALILLSVLAAPVQAQRGQGVAAAPESGAFVTRLGRDTLAVERFTRTRDRLEGEFLVRQPATALRRYTAALRPDGSVSRLRVELLPAAGATPQPGSTAGYTVDFASDTVTVRLSRVGRADTTLRVAVASAVMPALRYAYALQEQAMRFARAGRSDSVRVFSGASGQSFVQRLRAGRGDTVQISGFDGPAKARFDRRGRLLGWDAAGSTFQVVVDRAPSVNLPALAAEFARRDAERRGIGAVLSPRDSLHLAVGGANVSVAYGRPGKRGRQILGGLVPYDQVWRAGANITTHLRTDRTLELGGATLQPGVYSMYTLPRSSGWTLIVNRRVGQSGAVYDATQDVVRVPMVIEQPPAEAPESFAIRLEPQGERGGTIRMLWEGFQVSVPFTVVP